MSAFAAPLVYTIEKRGHDKSWVVDWPVHLGQPTHNLRVASHGAGIEFLTVFLFLHPFLIKFKVSHDFL